MDMQRKAKTGWLVPPARMVHRLSVPPGPYIAGVLLLVFLSTIVASLITPSGPGRQLMIVFCVLSVSLLAAFAAGLSHTITVYAATACGAVFLFAVSLTEGHLYSSTLAWLPLIPLAIFYVVHPRAGRVWMLLMAMLYPLMALVAWQWGGQLPRLQGEDLHLMSFIDYLLATVTVFLVPNFYQRDLERHLREEQARQSRLKAQQQTLEHTQQMQEHFIASVSHELRTPMNAILGLNAVLLERVQHRPRAQQVLEHTRQSADHLMTVINDVLDYSQMHRGTITLHPASCNLHETVRAAFALFLPRVENTRLHYGCDIGDDVPLWVHTDRHRLKQVLVNLLGNAIKFTEQGSVTLRVTAAAEGLCFEVCDTGIGIAPPQQQKIFESFSQADTSIQSRYGGSGLGLTISQRLVQMLGGRLQLESRPGQGSRFWFSLPLQAQRPPAHAELADRGPRPQVQQVRRFLVVDDHPVNRLLVRQVLLRQWPQAQIVEAENGQQALHRLAQQAVDLVLMDMVMPHMDGIEATRALRSHPQMSIARLPVLGLTANVNTGDLQRFEQAGLDALLLKPFEPPALLAQVERLLTLPRSEVRP